MTLNFVVKNSSLNFVVKKSPTEDRFMRYHPNDGIVWESSKDKANWYPSRYAAKKHLRVLDNAPADVIVEPV